MEVWKDAPERAAEALETFSQVIASLEESSRIGGRRV
jgi:hypothetical protein